MRLPQKRRPRGATRRGTPPTSGQWKTTWASCKTPLRWLGVLLVLGGVGAGLWIGSQKLKDPHAFPLRHVRIDGTLNNLAESDLKPLANALLGQNFFMADLDALRRSLATNPWIEKVAVRRWWPDVIDIELRERVAFGHWGEEEMVDINGQRFRPTSIRQPGPWPYLLGPQGHEKTLIQTYGKLRTLFEPLGLHLTKLRQDERRAWWLTFDNGLEIYVGRDQFEQRLQRLVQLYPRILAGQIERIAVLDLRYSNGFAVRWKVPPPSPAAG